MDFAMDYHMIFMVMSFMLLIISVLLIFIDTTFEKAVAANIFVIVNFVLCMLVSFGFGALDFYSYDSTGAIVHNTVAGMYQFIYVFWVLAYINLMLLFYCGYLYFKKPWEHFEKDNPNYMQY